MDAVDRQNKMAGLVFNKANLAQLKDALAALIDLFSEVLETPLESGNSFCHDDVLDRLDNISQERWRTVRAIYSHDPFYGNTGGNVTEEEMISPAKIMFDFVRAFDQISVDLQTKLQHYQDIFKKVSREKTQLEISLAKTENLVREERASNTQDRMNLKTARSSLAFLESLVVSKNERIAALQRQQNVQLWEREKERIFAESDKKIQVLEKHLAEQKKVNENLSRRVTQMDENNKMLRMKQDLSLGVFPPGTVKNNEDLKRSIFLLEKDVMFLEQQLYTQQRMFTTVLCGLKTDLLLLSDQVCGTQRGTKNKNFIRLCGIVSDIFKSMLEGDLSETVKSLPAHYSYLPNEFKIKRVKKLSRSSLPPLHQSHAPEADVSKTSEVVHVEHISDVRDPEEPIIENPRLTDPVTKTINSTRCMQYFPHMSQNTVREHWAKFQELDLDGNEQLDFTEVVRALTSMGLKFTAQQVEEAMIEADINKSRSLDFYEYLVVSDKLFSKKGTSELFHTGAASNETRRVMAKTCLVQ